MIKHIVLFLLLTGTYLSTRGQVGKAEYGVHSGVNINTAYGRSIAKPFKGSLAGFSTGVHLAYKLTDHFGLKGVVAYDENGWAYRSLTLPDNVNNTVVKADILFKLHYLNLPVMARYYFGNKVVFHIDAGVFAGMLLSNTLITKYKYEQPLPPNPQANIRSTSAYRKSTNFGFSAELGVQVPVSQKMRIEIGARNNTGLQNIYKGENAGDDSIIKTNAVTVFGGLTLTR